ncbi:MAG: asparaginase [Pseudonocardiaceae bacterium]|nr:asparaginase [Pseudonocardiaceae bacterium]
MTRIRLVATGGTIASRRTGGGHRAIATGAELLRDVAVPDGCEVGVVDAATVGSFAWQWSDLLALVRHLGTAFSEGADGVVVTHGTDTMEEVAFLASLVHDDPRPVVFTGAQRALDHPGADGPANLTDALLVAVDPAARDRGVLVCFDGRAYPARGVTKVDTLGTRGFNAPGRGVALRVAGGRVRPLTPAARPMTVPIDTSVEALPRVDVVPLYVGADPVLLRAAVDAGARGLVLAAFGAGNANPALVDAVRECDLLVLVCSRVPSGPVTPLYTGGGGADLAEAGAVFGDDLSPWQGRMLLAAALAAAPDDPRPLLARWLGV